MAINRIVTEKELNYIENIYLYANLEEFITKDSHVLDWLLGELNPKTNKLITTQDIANMYGEEKYAHMLAYIHDTLLHSAKLLGSTPTKTIYELANYKLVITDYAVAKKSNTFNVEIQYFQHHMFTLNRNLDGLELPFGGTHEEYHIKRIDICKIFKSPVDYTIGHNYLSPYRNVNGYNRRDNTVYLGNRKNGNVFRMYPKTIELKEKGDARKINLISSHFGDIEDLYTFELELHRNQLKGTLDIDTLDDLEKVYQAYKNIVGKIRIYEDNDHNKKLLKQNKRERIKGLMITDYVEYDRVLKKRYKTSKEYAMNSQEKTFNRYIETMGIKEEKEINKLRIEFGMNIASNGEQDVTIEFEDKKYISIPKHTKTINGNTYFRDSDEVIELSYDEMKKKRDELRGGNDHLQSDSNNAFKKANIQGWRDLF